MADNFSLSHSFRFLPFLLSFF
ncbi:CRISPR-associated DxTHG motif protein [Photorhabdus akhurstii]|nr:CRISPR-associated DxTHG motif protein [Photorhabdus akhurstii]